MTNSSNSLRASVNRAKYQCGLAEGARVYTLVTKKNLLYPRSIHSFHTAHGPIYTASVGDRRSQTRTSGRLNRGQGLWLTRPLGVSYRLTRSETRIGGLESVCAYFHDRIQRCTAFQWSSDNVHHDAAPKAGRSYGADSTYDMGYQLSWVPPDTAINAVSL